MKLIYPSCIKGADEALKCPFCAGCIVKNGKSRSGKQRYRCRACNKYFLLSYKNQAYNIGMSNNIVHLMKEGVGVRSMSRLLGVSPTTVMRRLLAIGNCIVGPALIKGKSYEVDEMKSYIKSKKRKIWIAYALERHTNCVVSFNIGSRTKKTINVVIKTLLYSSAKTIYTDGWAGYKSLIPWRQHSTWLHGTNHIERNNLSVRTHLKRLSRKTICFSRSKAMLAACLKIYFWG